MEKAHKDCIQSNFVELIDAISPSITDVVAYLFSKNILSKRMKGDILEGRKTNTDRAEKLLDIIPTRGPNAYDALCQAVEKAELHDAVTILNEGRNVHQDEDAGLVQETAACNLENIDVHQQVPRAPEPVGDSECGKDMGDGPNSTVSWLGSKQELRFIEDTDTEALKLFAEHLHNEEEYYLMSGQPRGQVLVIDNDEFIKHPKFPRLKSRPGSKEDSKDIDKLFTGLGFTVHVKQNLTRKQMRKLLKNKLAEKELENCDCFVVFLLSHGDKGVVFGTDGYRDGMEPQNCLELTDVRYMLCNCKYLTGKPKLLFVQACQGKKRDSGIDRVASRQSTVASGITGAQETGDNEIDEQVMEKVLEDLVPSEASDGITKLPTFADFFVAMSTIDGYISKRGDYGSWYIQGIIRVFSLYAYKLELSLLMRKVNDLMSDTGNKVKQIGRATDSLRKQFYFFPGLPRAPH